MTAITAFFERSDVHDEVKPYAWDGPAMEALPQSNFVMKERELNLTDVRTVPDFQPTIEDNGFCFLQTPSKELSNMTGRNDCKPYLEEQARFLKKRFGTDEVWAINANVGPSQSVSAAPVAVADSAIPNAVPRFTIVWRPDWTSFVRTSRYADPKTGRTSGSFGVLTNATAWATDNTVNSSWERISLFLTEEERERVLSGRTRARIINIWRPMVNHAEDIPFAVCDPKTNTDLEDVVAVDRITPQAAKELAYFAWNPEHRWYWLSNQTPDEVVIMTQYDTHPPGGMFNIVPHAAFRNGAARAGCPPRQSVEARFIVLEPAPYEKAGPGPAGPFPEDPRKQPWKDFVNPPKPEPAPAPTADNRPMYF